MGTEKKCGFLLLKEFRICFTVSKVVTRLVIIMLTAIVLFGLSEEIGIISRICISLPCVAGFIWSVVGLRKVTANGNAMYECSDDQIVNICNNSRYTLDLHQPFFLTTVSLIVAAGRGPTIRSDYYFLFPDTPVDWYCIFESGATHSFKYLWDDGGVVIPAVPENERFLCELLKVDQIATYPKTQYFSRMLQAEDESGLQW